MAIYVTFGDGFEQPEDEACSSFERCLPQNTSLREVKEILAAWAGCLAETRVAESRRWSSNVIQCLHESNLRI
jgi:hypothetical protein